MKQRLTRAEYLQLVGLITLAGCHNEQLKQLVQAGRALLGADKLDEVVHGIGSPEHIDDAIYGSHGADALLELLGVSVED